MVLSLIAFQCPSCRTAFDHPPFGRKTRCEHCGYDVEFFENIPLLVTDFRQTKSQIDQRLGSKKSSWFHEAQCLQLSGPYRHHLKKRIDYLQQVIADAFPTGREVDSALDLGCGDGINIPWMQGISKELYASDYNLLRLLRVANTFSIRYLYLADLLNYPVAGNSFDLVLCNHVLEHIQADEAALSEMHRILKPNGLLLLGTPNEGAAFWKFAYRIDPATRASTDHVHFYTADTLSEKCRRAGFRILDIHHMGWGLPCWQLDAKVRRHKVFDDLFELVGRRLFKSQATSLYLVLRK